MLMSAKFNYSGSSIEMSNILRKALVDSYKVQFLWTENSAFLVLAGVEVSELLIVYFKAHSIFILFSVAHLLKWK